jgi:hypothetical protein
MSGPPTPEGEYIVVDPLVLETIKELAWLAQVDRHTLPTVRLLLRVVQVDDEGRLGVRFSVIRDLHDDPPERGFGSI